MSKIIIETRTGSGVKRHEVQYKKGFGYTPGVINSRSLACNRGFLNKLESFYGEIDRRLRDSRLVEDYDLGCPYAIREAEYKENIRQKLAKLEQMAIRHGRARI